MPTTKRRIPVTLNQDLARFLPSFAEARDLSLSKAIEQLALYGMEMAEDEYFSSLADSLDTKSKTFISHEDFWSKALAV